MNLCRLIPSDAPAYRALMLNAYERHPDAFTATVQERENLPLAWWESRLAHTAEARELVIGAFDDGKLAGAAGLLFETRPRTRHKATLFGMYVPLVYRKMGLGRKLVKAVLEAARARPGVKIVQLTVTAGNAPALALYEHCGFAIFGVEPFAVAHGDDFLSKVHMWLDLYPQSL